MTRFVLDSEPLADAGAQLDSRQWKERLAAAGVLAAPIGPGELPPGLSAVREVQRALSKLQVAALPPERPAWIRLAAGGWFVAGWALPIVLNWVGLALHLVSLVGLGIWWVWPRLPAARAARQAAAAEALRLRIQRLLSRAWIEETSEMALESVPQASFLAHRLEDLRQAEAGLRAREAELAALAERVAAADGAPGAEGEALAAERGRIQARLGQLEGLREELVAQRAALGESVETLRQQTARLRLSQQVAASLEQDTGEEALARVEVDVAGIESRLRALEVDLGHGDAQLRAALELG